MARVPSLGCIPAWVWVLLPLLAYQYAHWFKPINAYIVDYEAAHGGISNQVMYDQVYPLFTYSLLPATLLAAVAFEIIGPWASLALSAVLDVASTALLYPARSDYLAPLLASQVAFAFSFAALFLGTAAAAKTLAPVHYQRGTSIQRAAQLMGTMTSSLIGQALVSAHHMDVAMHMSVAVGSISIFVAIGMWAWQHCQRSPPLLDDDLQPRTGPHKLRSAPRSNGIMLTDALLSEETGAVTLASRSVSAEAALYGVSSAVEGAAAFHPGDERQQQLLPARSEPWRTAISLRVKRTLSTLHIVITSPTLATLAIGNVITLAVHTLVMTMWQSLLEDVSPGEQWNGSISAAAYAISAIFVAIISAQRIDKYVSRCTVAVQAVYALVLAAATWGMALSRSFELVVVSLVVYHVCAEMLLVTGSASIARIAVRVAARRNEYLPMPTGDADDAHSKSGASRRAGDAEEMPGSLPSTTAAAAVDSVAHGSMYGFITFISQLLQIAVQLGFGPQGLQFSLQRRFAVYAALCTLCCLLMAAMAVPLRCGRAR